LRFAQSIDAIKLFSASTFFTPDREAEEAASSPSQKPT